MWRLCGCHDNKLIPSPLSLSFAGRGLPHDTLNKPYSIYEVLKPLEVNSGPAIPWFGQRGLGTQHETLDSIENLVTNGFLRKI